jgi:hypothetical protein
MNNKITFVTSMNEEGYHKYGKTMLDSVRKFWSDDLTLVCYYHDFEMPEEGGGTITFKNLNDVQDMLDYREQFKQYNGQTPNGYNWRMDAIKWCHKVFALSEEAFLMAEESKDAGWMIWLDADTVTTKPFCAEDIQSLLTDKCSIVHLGRTAADYSETSFVAFNLNRQNPLELIADLRGAYISGEVLGYREWHDGFIFERLLNIYKAHGTETYNLSPTCKDLNAFNTSVLSQWFTHFKGNLKDKGVAPDVNGPKRYGQLLELVDHYKPKSVIETGTWNGGRAIQMAEVAFRHTDTFQYSGWDMFEEATEESDAVELNTKAHNSVEAVNARLQEYRDKKKAEGKTFNFSLTKGDTNKTLIRTARFDMAYIDGGHSYPTTKNDYDKIDAPVVVLDDFFSADADGNMPDAEHCGTNRLLDDLKPIAEEEKLRVKVLYSEDRVKDGGCTHLAVVLRDDTIKDIPDNLRKVPIVVTPKDCMPDEYIINNVNTNLEDIGYDNWIQHCQLTDEKLIIVSGGDFDYQELADFVFKNPLRKTAGYKIACVKHSYPKLLDMGIVPDYCVVLDPRPIDGESTHGVIRKDLFKEIEPSVTFLVASMTDPSVVQHLVGQGAKIKLWHAYSEAIRDNTVTDKLVPHPDCKIPDNSTFVTGGTCAATRTIGLFHILGFRHFELWGFNGSVEDITDAQKEEKLDTDQTKYLKVEINDNNYWTTGELLALAQDCEKLFDRTDIDYSIDFKGDGTLLSEVWKSSRKSHEPTYKDII